MIETTIDPYAEPAYQVRRIQWDDKYTFRIYVTDMDGRWRRFGKKQWVSERYAHHHAEVHLQGYARKETVTDRQGGKYQNEQ